jgi:hypothetical protein
MQGPVVVADSFVFSIASVQLYGVVYVFKIGCAAATVPFLFLNSFHLSTSTQKRAVDKILRAWQFIKVKKNRT